MTTKKKAAPKKGTKTAEPQGVAIELVPITGIKPNPGNPRVVRDEKFLKLVASIESFPDMLNKRPLVVVEDADGLLMVLGGNQRFRACQHLGLKTVPVIRADSWTEEQRREFVIKDNASAGEWDFDMLANEWDAEKLGEWGIDHIGSFSEDPDPTGNDAYTKKVKAPTYEPKNERPEIGDLVDGTKHDELLSKIEADPKLSPEEKAFLRKAATRHLVFDYGRIADLYANGSAELQRSMEASALVIIDFDKAIENGFAELSDRVADQYREDTSVEDED